MPWEHYVPVFLFLMIALVIGVAMLSIGFLLGPSKPNAEKNSAYECGYPAFEQARAPFDVRFYLVAILFIVFDLETALLFPWAVSIKQISWFGFFSMMAFLGLLGIGFIYEWRKGALTWE